ncbi:glycosyltransferase family 2 protein [Aliikangiella sp. IMCC44653]
MNLNILLVVSLIGVAYSYFIYPIILLLLPKRQASTGATVDDSSLPSMTFIITAFNEESQIKSKLENTLAAQYPQELLEILVASDGSTDKTNQIVTDFASQGVRLVHVAERKGKENAQKSAIQAAQGDILVFSDVSTKIEPHALKVIANAFQNPKVGAVSSEDRFISEDGTIAGEGAYVKYEMWLRQQEAAVNTLVGLSGSFFSARRSICQTWDISVPSDFNTAINCYSQGYIAISEPKMLGFYPNLKDETKEYQRKVRTVIRGIAALFAKPKFLNPFKYGLFSFQLISHKLMRWTVPWFLILCFISNLLLVSQHSFYQLLMLAQVSFYLVALLGWMSAKARAFSLIKIPYFFVQVNLAIAHATLQYISGKRVTVWAPSKR